MRSRIGGGTGEGGAGPVSILAQASPSLLRRGLSQTLLNLAERLEITAKTLQNLVEPPPDPPKSWPPARRNPATVASPTGKETSQPYSIMEGKINLLRGFPRHYIPNIYPKSVPKRVQKSIYNL